MVRTYPEENLLPADALLQLAVQVLELETVLVSLLDGDHKNVLAATGFVDSGISMDPPAICHWSLVPSLHQMVIVEDTLEDARWGPFYVSHLGPSLALCSCQSIKWLTLAGLVGVRPAFATPYETVRFQCDPFIRIMLGGCRSPLMMLEAM